MATIPAYQGEHPYIFISYAHADSKAVLQVVKELVDRNYRVWYDEGIEVGADWPEVIAGHLMGAHHVMVFTSAAFARSQNCQRELNFAVDQKKHLSRVKLDATPLSEGSEMQLSVVPTAEASTASPAQICDTLEAQGCLTETLLGDGVEGYAQTDTKTKKRLNKWIAATIIFAVLFLGAAGVALGLTQGWFSSAGVHMQTASYDEDSGRKDESFSYTTWNDPVSRDLLLSTMNGSSLYLCGNAFVSSGDAIDYRDGAWRLGDEEIPQGTLTDFAVPAAKGGITELAMVNQQLTDLSTVTVLSDLTYLDISGNNIRDLSPLKELPELKILKLAHMPDVDLSTLMELPVLQRVYISTDMVNMAKPYLHANFDVVIKE